MSYAIDEIITALQVGAVQVANLLQKRDVEYSDTENTSGDNQLRVDILADRLFGDILGELNIKGFASEEREEAVCLKQNQYAYDNDAFDIKSHSLLVAYDPLDGSSLMDSNLTIGSIFGIYVDEFQGKNLVASLYFLYGPRLEMVVAKDSKSMHYLYDYTKHTWEFIQRLELKEEGKLNSPGGTQKYWYAKHKDLIESFFLKGYRLRYSGGMVADLHQILCKGGGIFSYPATTDSKQGKLRNLFEVFPFAYIFESAGGKATNGSERLLDIHTDSIHASTPCFFGSNNEMQIVHETYKS
ncbi:fructose-1,6-bisphosphatase [Helicobacter trogontum]|uniref:Fructose-1,6-bisphosphatase class 1 n=1 Tax=Helicobacter trogontum TaxID=50960 RepID=A0A4V6HZF7_9HELI|nr:fructose-1,6-bisphosphatase [Helicobacter trogontum]